MLTVTGKVLEALKCGYNHFQAVCRNTVNSSLLEYAA